MRAAFLLLLLLPLTACNYGFTGGGLPGHIRTVAVLAFQNNTSQPLLETDIQRKLQEELPRSLGVRIAEESVADALVRGTVTSYDEVVSSVRPTQPGSQNDEILVQQRQVRIVFNAEIYDLRQDQVIWRAQGQSVLGTFSEGESQEAGRTRALEELVTRFVEGAQSQW
jgi:hypothetical protein